MKEQSDEDEDEEEDEEEDESKINKQVSLSRSSSFYENTTTITNTPATNKSSRKSSKKRKKKRKSQHVLVRDAFNNSLAHSIFRLLETDDILQRLKLLLLVVGTTSLAAFMVTESLLTYFSFQVNAFEI